VKVGSFITHRLSSLDALPEVFAGVWQSPDYVKGVVQLQPE